MGIWQIWQPRGAEAAWTLFFICWPVSDDNDCIAPEVKIPLCQHMWFWIAWSVEFCMRWWTGSRKTPNIAALSRDTALVGFIPFLRTLYLVQTTSANFVLGWQRIAIALLRNFEIERVNCCSCNACVFLPFENIVLVFVTCGHRLARVRQKCVNQRGSLKLRSTGRISQDRFRIWPWTDPLPSCGFVSAWRSGISDPAIPSSERSVQVVRDYDFKFQSALVSLLDV